MSWSSPSRSPPPRRPRLSFERVERPTARPGRNCREVDPAPLPERRITVRFEFRDVGRRPAPLWGRPELVRRGERIGAAARARRGLNRS
jgi:hypothetical protein